MSSDQPYNALGQILASGGEIAVGLSILQKGGAGSALFYLGKKFGELDDEQQETLTNLADQMIKSGASLQQLPPGTPIPVGDIPLNEFLFGGDLQGRRVLVTGEVEIPGADQRVQIRLPFSDVSDIDEIREAFLARGLDIAGQYPGKFGLDPNTPIGSGNVYILLPERAF